MYLWQEFYRLDKNVLPLSLHVGRKNKKLKKLSEDSSTVILEYGAQALIIFILFYFLFFLQPSSAVSSRVPVKSQAANNKNVKKQSEPAKGEYSWFNTLF